MGKDKKNKNKGKQLIKTTDFLLKLCHSVTSVLTEATHHEINFSPMVQRITKTCLKPDIVNFPNCSEPLYTVDVLLQDALKFALVISTVFSTGSKT